jgi:hypothetical protein
MKDTLCDVLILKPVNADPYNDAPIKHALLFPLYTLSKKYLPRLGSLLF